MRFVLGLLAGLLGLLAGWFALALAVISLSGPDRDGGVAMGAFFGVGPIGGLAGFVAGVALFRKFGLVRPAAPTEGASDAAVGTAAAPAPARVHPAVAAALLLAAAVLIGWAWRELLT